MAEASVAAGFDLHPDSRLIVGLRPNWRTPGDLIVNLDVPTTRLHTHVRDPEAIRGLWAAWNGATGHLTTRVPREALCECAEGAPGG